MRDAPHCSKLCRLLPIPALVIVALIACSSAPSHRERGEPPPAADLVAYLEWFRAGYGLPAVTALVLRGDEIVAMETTGVRRRGDSTAALIDDPYHLGSCTKPMTGTLAALLVDEGSLSWDTTMDQGFPEAIVHPGFSKVTVLDLLLHRGGAPADFDHRRYASSDEPLIDVRRAFAVDLLSRAPSERRERAVYSNAGYVVVGAILEARSGKPWETLMRERLFEPLGMTSCGFGPPGTREALDAPRGHNGRRVFEPGPAADNPPFIGPAGTVHCSLRDWSRFAAMHLAGARGESTFLSPAAFLRLHTPDPGPGLPYAVGWGTEERSSGFTLLAFGSNTKWTAGVKIVPSRNKAVLAATNIWLDDRCEALEELVDGLIEVD